MPTLNTAFFFKVLRVLLEYGMLIWLLLMISRLGRQMFLDMRVEFQAQCPPERRQDEAVLAVIEAGEPDLAGRRYAFSEQIALGRGEDNDVIIPENFVSHHHAVIFRHGNQYVLEDLGSRNHTYVNGQVLEGKVYLRSGDLVRIGMVELRFER